MRKEGVIYLVDDNSTVAGIVSKIISNSLGIDVVEFLTGELLIQQLSIEVPDLIIIDYLLDTGNSGAMNGSDVLEHIRSAGLDIPVILLTGITSEEKLEELRSMSFDVVLHKDSDLLFKELTDTIKRYISFDGEFLYEQ